MKFYTPEQYQPLCKTLFFRYQYEISSLLPKARVEHIGASSIPMAISKGDLDIFVGVEAAHLEEAVSVLSSLGFHEKPDTLRTPQLCMLESTSEKDVALQVVANNSEFDCFLTFRDALSVHSSLVQQYNQLKIFCEGLPHEEYRKKKSIFIEHVLLQIPLA